MEDLDISQTRIGESAQRVLDRALDEARRHRQTEFTPVHLFLAFAQVEWDTFAESMRDLDLNPHAVLKAVEDQVQTQVPVGKTHLWDAKARIGVAGDWCTGHRVEDAFLSGLSLALAVI